MRLAHVLGLLIATPRDGLADTGIHGRDQCDRGIESLPGNSVIQRPLDSAVGSRLARLRQRDRRPPEIHLRALQARTFFLPHARILGKPDQQREIAGRGGNDSIYTRDGTRDFAISCGAGADVLTSDRSDPHGRSC